MQEYLLQQSPAPWDHVILRLQNVYGPGQSLRNPYTGVLSIFCQQVMAGRTLNIFEDGEIYRDFIFVDDVVSAFVAACATDAAGGQIINIGDGRATSIREAAELILKELKSDRGLTISGDFRAGDVRYAVADTRKAHDLLGWSPQISFEQGVAALVAWARNEAEAL
jgi:dTDP-L-rhamnose 4-epimerase